MFGDKIKKGNLIESVIDNIEEKAKYNQFPLKEKHRNIIGMKRRMQYYKKLKKQIYNKICADEVIMDNVSPKNNKYIWFCWLQGIENAPEIVKVCYSSVKRNVCEKSDWKLVLITEENLSDYINLPDYIYEKYKKGIIGPAAFSDLIRLELLIQYGGIWSDSTVFWTGSRFLEILDHSSLFFPSKWVFFDGEIMMYDNWMIKASKNNRVLRTIQKCLYEYWKVYDFRLDYFVFHLFTAMVMEDHPKEVQNMPFLSVHTCEFLQMNYYDQVNENVLKSILLSTDIHKLNYKDKPTGNIDGTYYKWICNYSEPCKN